jgi:hypothetical protein
MDRNELQNRLVISKDNYIFGLAAISLFGREKTYTMLEKNFAEFGKYLVSFDQVVEILNDDELREASLKQFVKMLVRALIKESFEAVEEYCRESGQSEILESQDWYEYARIIHDCIANNCRFNFTAHDISLLPLTWKEHTLTHEAEGQLLELVEFAYVETWELFQEFQEFVEQKLN